jgi:tetratricopeptide (TPR) repeat protein
MNCSFFGSRGKTSIEVLIAEAQSLQNNGQHTLAIEKFEQVLVLLEYANPETRFPENKVDKYLVPTLYGLAVSYLELQRYYKANDWCKALLEFRPNMPKAKKLCGLICVHTGDYNGAMKTVKMT